MIASQCSREPFCAATAAPRLCLEIADQRAEAPGAGKEETLAPPGGEAPEESSKESPLFRFFHRLGTCALITVFIWWFRGTLSRNFGRGGTDFSSWTQPSPPPPPHQSDPEPESNKPKSNTCLITKILSGSDCQGLTLNGTTLRLHLANIQTPDPDQTYGPQAKSLLSDYILNQSVRIETFRTDRSGCSQVRLRLGNSDIAFMLLQNGAAWSYPQFQSPSETRNYRSAQDEAYDRRIGLWSQPSPEPPWAFRDRPTRQAR